MPSACVEEKGVFFSVLLFLCLGGTVRQDTGDWAGLPSHGILQLMGVLLVHMGSLSTFQGVVMYLSAGGSCVLGPQGQA